MLTRQSPAPGCCPGAASFVWSHRSGSVIAGLRNNRNCTSHTHNPGSQLRLELQNNLAQKGTRDWKSWVLRRVLSTGMDPTGTRKLLAYARISCGIRPQARFGAGAPAPLRFHQPVSASAPKYRGPCNTGEHQGTMRNHAFPKSARATSSRPDCPHLTFGASNCADLDTSSRRLNMARGQG
jgi:hypothetical protein